MSCHTLPDRSQFNLPNGDDNNYEIVGTQGNNNNNASFANLDIAYDSTLPMNDFQRKMMLGNQPQNEQDNTLFENSRQDQMVLSPQSEEKINNNVDEIVNTFYNRDADFLKQNGRLANKQYLYPHIPAVQDGVKIPLDRSQNYPSRNGSELLEDFNLQQDAQRLQQEAQRAWNTTNTTSYNITGMSFFKFVLLVVLLVALIYGVYWLYKTGSDKNSNIMGDNETIVTSVQKVNKSIEKLFSGNY